MCLTHVVFICKTCLIKHVSNMCLTCVNIFLFIGNEHHIYNHCICVEDTPIVGFKTRSYNFLFVLVHAFDNSSFCLAFETETHTAS